MLSMRDDILDHLPKGGICTEIGVAEGYFSRIILDKLKPKKLHLIDPFIYDDTHCSKDHQFRVIRGRFTPEIQAGLVEIDRGMSWDILPTFPDKYFDFMYVDGDHSYDGVHRDLELCKTKIKPDGIIQCNDYKLEPSFNERAYGVVQAVNESCIEYDYEMIYFSFNTNLYADVALRKRGVVG